MAADAWESALAQASVRLMSLAADTPTRPSLLPHQRAESDPPAVF